MIKYVTSAGKKVLISVLCNVVFESATQSEESGLKSAIK
jgi:hypothetical protein